MRKERSSDYRVYAAGGMGLDLRPHNYMQHYDMLKDIWVSLAAMPTPRYAAASFLRGTKIYVLGGRQSKYAINAFEVFDTETRSWTKFPNIPSKRAFSTFVPTESKLFSLGGLRQGRLYRQPKFMRTMDVFDIEQGGWMKMERSFFLKKRRADFVSGYLKGRVVVAGGLGNQPTVLESAEAFHPEKNKWECLPPMPTPRCACSSVVVKNCLLAVGGVNQGLSDAVEALTHGHKGKSPSLGKGHYMSHSISGIAHLICSRGTPDEMDQTSGYNRKAGRIIFPVWQRGNSTDCWELLAADVQGTKRAGIFEGWEYSQFLWCSQGKNGFTPV
ncbi:kelch domain-containing protein 8A [Alligator mississippiensis]|uniref:Kelch domain-containing protein 8A n=1 Tax=Alligator mississippiensis TaxID=8496 RepID=A0A151MAS8_ALLMI|nr:kelch domain-containing protein 8A [Alligator mississippiensis]